MPDKTLHFLSGLPRSGSTVLAAILNQNPATKVSTTSGLVHALNGLAETWHNAHLLDITDPDRKKLASSMRAVIGAFYEDEEKPVIIDKSRGWPISRILSAMSEVLQRPAKIIATVRSVPDCAASFVRIAKPEDLAHFIYNDQTLAHLKAAYLSLKDGFDNTPEHFLFVEYDELLKDPKRQLARVHEFLGLPYFEYDFDNIDGASVEENDEDWHGYAGMHDVARKLEARHNQAAKDVLGKFYNQFVQPEFWTDVPKAVPDLNGLDLQVTLTRLGDFSEGWRIAEELRLEDPTDDRAAYNRSWYLMRQGNIREGYRQMERGRRANVLGSRPESPAPEWDGVSKGTVLLHLEHGLGDQIHQVRYAKDIAARGCRVLVSCTGALAELFTDVDGVSAVLQHEASFGVVHDYWQSAMFAPLQLGYDLEDISGAPYIRRPFAIKSRRPRIGLRWQGSSRFEPDHNKKFPYELMFEAVRGLNVEIVSLQRDEGVSDTPTWVKQLPVKTWGDTRQSIASCDLVISACTSVSHLSAAMGVPTWVVQPIMPYYLYAIDGEKTPYYESMTLFRQKEFGEWGVPFQDIRDKLSEMYDRSLAAE